MRPFYGDGVAMGRLPVWGRFVWSLLARNWSVLMPPRASALRNRRLEGARGRMAPKWLLRLRLRRLP